uniref:Reelin domain-containing protein n=1 Tax=Cynoglossus semilaevis TaxID=244447 RepID=A0A3P8V1U3_CYNSE
MLLSVYCLGVGVVLFIQALPSSTFSRGASLTSCQEMIPGHIQAQPQELQQSYVTLLTSASSYLPGQFITVTVRSSRDFMGFLLQARSSDVVEAGSWTFTPPGSHSLRCLSEGDTLTHSDKQLKRNLSFVWRAPDVPMGDIFFYHCSITVVQSYFVYWAGIESGLVRDQGRSSWSWSNAMRMDDTASTIALQKHQVTALPETLIFQTTMMESKSKSQTESSQGDALEWTTGATQTFNHPQLTSGYDLFATNRLEVRKDEHEDRMQFISEPYASSLTTSLNPSKISKVVSLRPTFRSTLKYQPKTFPALSALASPSPISVPAQTIPVQSPPTYPKPLNNSSNHLLTTTLFPLGSKFNPHSSTHMPSTNFYLDTSSAPSTTSSVPAARTDSSPSPTTFRLNHDHELKPIHVNTDTKQKQPSKPPGPPTKEGKYPEMIPRHSSWELGMLLGCSAGLGMVLVVGVRYMYRQACGKRTGVTLNDREREYERGERGLIHVQECGDLVRVRRIRDNSFVLLAEYDILAAPGD